MTSVNSNAAKMYYGLENQGATCYLNSVLQVLFMTKDFRENVICYRDSGDSGDKKCTDPLKHLFENLKKSKAKTCDITKKLGIRVHEQCDAAEYIEKILNETSPEASKIFQGELTRKNICKQCSTEKKIRDRFWSLPLTLKSDTNEYNVDEAIQDFFSVLHTDAENQLYCEKCRAKTNANIELEISLYPEVLMLLLKRFKFDYQYQQNVKIKQAVTVPDTLQIPETYELYAFVEHFGELSFGHYTATIKSQDNKRWYNFNDTHVTLLKDKILQKKIEASKTAYLLFYRRKKRNQEDDEKRKNNKGDQKMRKRKADNMETYTRKFTQNYHSDEDPHEGGRRNLKEQNMPENGEEKNTKENKRDNKCPSLCFILGWGVVGIFFFYHFSSLVLS